MCIRDRDYALFLPDQSLSLINLDGHCADFGFFRHYCVFDLLYLLDVFVKHRVNSDLYRLINDAITRLSQCILTIQLPIQLVDLPLFVV